MLDQGTMRVTTDHGTIRNWVTERGGSPALVRRVGQIDQGSLLINFPDDGSDEPIVDISWADFFQRFEDQKLAFEYRDIPPGEAASRDYGFTARQE
jgi:hypothetical protein